MLQYSTCVCELMTIFRELISPGANLTWYYTVDNVSLISLDSLANQRLYVKVYAIQYLTNLFRFHNVFPKEEFA